MENSDLSPTPRMYKAVKLIEQQRCLWYLHRFARCNVAAEGCFLAVDTEHGGIAIVLRPSLFVLIGVPSLQHKIMMIHESAPGCIPLACISSWFQNRIEVSVVVE